MNQFSRISRSSGTQYVGKAESALSRDEIRRYQGILIAQGYNLGTSGADGQIGSRTRSAVREYQTRKSVTGDASGVLGVNTQESLEYDVKENQAHLARFRRTETYPATTTPRASTPSTPSTPRDSTPSTPRDSTPSTANTGTGAATGALMAQTQIQPATLAAIGVGVVVVGLAIAYSTGAFSGSAGRVVRGRGR